MRLGEYAILVSQYLSGLASLDPIFASGKVDAARLRKSVPVSVDDPDLVAHLIEYLDEPDDRSYVVPVGFTDRDAQGKTTAASTNQLGLHFAYDTLGKAGERISITLNDGYWGESLDTASVKINFPEKGDPRFRSDEFAESVLRMSVAFWRPFAGWLTTVPFIRAVGDRDDEFITIGWRTYLGQPAAIDHLPRDADVERIQPGGALIKLHGTAFDPADPAQIREACHIRDVLRGRRLLGHNYLESPPDSQTIGRGLPAIDIRQA
jgi:hypothetical protein